ncbi:GntR family transcriptional regulator / MocR family aminotransferase [Paenibacillus uliginis N3/975]|uniref:GntR family transcriptional regulator / MocR family aminotransferase n=1 Tax=Paenibacillus uliginis N3/975 TaxID=1313296 RepID=A0A1X7GT20_9BACL|nr:GntR family transcriptional regulator / MocR family aminotransferase [Paenibacillus uliginis N3/975]
MKYVSINLAEMNWSAEDSSTPLYVQLYQYMKKEISTGRWQDQARLPSVRKLADFLGMSTTPVEMAYQQLLAEGFILSRPRSGYFVQKLTDTPVPIPAEPPPPQGRQLPRHRSYRYDFHMSKNDYEHFPLTEWRKTYNRVLQEEQVSDLLFYGDPQGEEGLRYEIAKYARSMRGVSCSPEQVVIGSDPYPLLELLCRLLRPYGKDIAVENPGYPQYPELFRQSGYSIHPISLQAGGLDQQSLRASGATFVTVSPSHQFPTGKIMPVSQRLDLLQWAKECGGFIIEDDYDGEFRYYGRPIPCLQGLVSDSRVIYLGGFAQVLSPSLGIQYMILPSILLEEYHHLKHHLFVECTASRIHQRTLERFMQDGFVDRHLRKMITILRKKHDTLISSIRKHFGDRAVVSGTGAGFHLILSLQHPSPEAELQAAAEDQGIRVHSIAYTYDQKPEHAGNPNHKREFIVGFAGIKEEDIDEGIRRLANCWL